VTVRKPVEPVNFVL